MQGELRYPGEGHSGDRTRVHLGGISAQGSPVAAVLVVEELVLRKPQLRHWPTKTPPLVLGQVSEDEPHHGVRHELDGHLEDRQIVLPPPGQDGIKAMLYDESLQPRRSEGS
jgi:hypothetical protein